MPGKYNRWNAYVAAQKQRARTEEEEVFLYTFYRLFPRQNQKTMRLHARGWIKTKQTALDMYREFLCHPVPYPYFCDCCTNYKYTKWQDHVASQIYMAGSISDEVKIATTVFWWLNSRALSNKQVAFYGLTDFTGEYRGATEHLQMVPCTGNWNCDCDECAIERQTQYYEDYRDYVTQTMWD